ncbi:hypothetical protein ABIE53_004494 [Burkholderia sp. OAS925]
MGLSGRQIGGDGEIRQRERHARLREREQQPAADFDALNAALRLAAFRYFSTARAFAGGRFRCFAHACARP